MRVLSGGHDVPEDKIISRYDKALNLIPELVSVSDICNIYDNTMQPYRIFKKRKDKYFYDDGSEFWKKENIDMLTNIANAEFKNLNI